MLSSVKLKQYEKSRLFLLQRCFIFLTRDLFVSLYSGNNVCCQNSQVLLTQLLILFSWMANIQSVVDGSGKIPTGAPHVLQNVFKLSKIKTEVIIVQLLGSSLAHSCMYFLVYAYDRTLVKNFKCWVKKCG